MEHTVGTSLHEFWDKMTHYVSQKRSGNSRLRSNKEQEFLVIGLGRFGSSLAMTLEAYDHNVLAVDINPQRVQTAANTLPNVVQLDATKVEALEEIGVEAFHTGIVCIGTSFEANLLTTSHLQKLGVKEVITRARTLTQQDILKKLGASEVILPEPEAGIQLGRRLAAINFVDFLELGNDMGVVEIVAPEFFVDKSLKESNVRQKYNLTVVAIRRGDKVLVSPPASEVVQQEDILVVLGQLHDCEQLR